MPKEESEYKSKFTKIVSRMDSILIIRAPSGFILTKAPTKEDEGKPFENFAALSCATDVIQYLMDLYGDWLQPPKTDVFYDVAYDLNDVGRVDPSPKKPETKSSDPDIERASDRTDILPPIEEKDIPEMPPLPALPDEEISEQPPTIEQHESTVALADKKESSHKHSSESRGVSKKGKKWKATAYYDKNSHYIGLFDTEKDAADAVKFEESKAAKGIQTIPLQGSGKTATTQIPAGPSPCTWECNKCGRTTLQIQASDLTPVRIVAEIMDLLD